LAVAASGLACELREVVLRDKPAAMLEASPKGTVPVLVLADGTVIDESLDIMQWALQQHDPLGWLKPDDGDVPTMLQIIAECDVHFKHHLDRYKYPQRYDDADTPQAHRLAGAQWLHALDAQLQTHPYLFGRRAALADMAIAPFVRQFAHVDKEWFWSQPWPGVLRWLDAFLASEIFARVMVKTKPWVPSAPGIAFPA